MAFWRGKRKGRAFQYNRGRGRLVFFFRLWRIWRIRDKIAWSHGSREGSFLFGCLPDQFGDHSNGATTTNAFPLLLLPPLLLLLGSIHMELSSYREEVAYIYVYLSCSALLPREREREREMSTANSPM